MDQTTQPGKIEKTSSMKNPAKELQGLSSTSKSMKFEQPLTERMRTFLRIELLHRQARFHSEATTELSARAAISNLLEILAILNRGDIRTDVMKELDRQSEILISFSCQPGVDPTRVQVFVNELRALQEGLADCGPKLIGPLQECDFLNNIKHRSLIPGGTCMFDLPDYAYWLRLPYEERSKELLGWLMIIRPICDAVEQVLWLIRETNEPTKQSAVHGMHQHNIERKTSPNLVRVLLPMEGGIYPQISAGKHRFTIHFVRWQGTNKRPIPVEEEISFLLALC
jgi:cell division protein ZapD